MCDVKRFGCVLLMLLAIVMIGRREGQVVAVGITDAPGKAIMERQCLSCHEADLIVSQRLSRTGWTREVEKMVRWGAVVAGDEKEPLIDYLAVTFAPRKQTPAPPANPTGAAIFEQKCLSCHEADLTKQQRLSRTGWTREVEKMIRWGAVVTDGEKDPLINYLTASFGPSTPR